MSNINSDDADDYKGGEKCYCPIHEQQPRKLYKCPVCGSFGSIDEFINAHICETTGRRPMTKHIIRAIDLREHQQ